MRAFLAIDLPKEAKKEILRSQGLLKRSGLFEGKFVEEENLHLTLKFFGEIPEQQAVVIEDILKKVRFPRFVCRLGKIGFFGSRILWVNIEDGGEIKMLHDLVDKKLEFFDADLRFHNHVTLARIKRVVDRKRLIEFAEKIDIHSVEFPVEEFVLKKSELMAEGPLYTDVFRFKLE